MKILITGAGGMLGTDLVLELEKKHSLIGVGRKPAPHLQIAFHPLDLSEGRAALELITAEKPEIVLHAAAMTEVDRCEGDRRRALLDNFESTRKVTDACNRINALVIYFGTDFVFDGKNSAPYKEEDIPRPISVYGETKLLGERYVLLRAKRFLILRASWLFGKYGDNFPKKILKQAEAGKKEIRVVADEFGNPTFTHDLAEAVTKIVDALQSKSGNNGNQIYHIANEGTVSRFEFARAILKRKSYPPELAVPIARETIHLPAARPQNSALSTEKLKTRLGIQLRPWEEALEAYLQEDLANLRQ